MLAPKAQLNLKHAREYFREHLSVGDYYAEGQKVTGQWLGQGAEMLGLKNPVTEVEFLRMCEGLHPKTGEKLTQRRNSERRENGRNVANRRVFYDFTFSPPKSVSVVALLQDERIVAVHDGAVRTAMQELERYAETRVRQGKRDAERVSGNLVGATFRHDTSRELDPHLHTHCVVLNATFDPEERRWKALQAAGMYRAQKLAESFYYHELCRGLRKLSYAIEPNARDFEIKAVPHSVIEKFSKRHRQIEAETRRRLERGAIRGNVKDAREAIARDVRKRKNHTTRADRLRDDWLRELDSHERAALRALRGASPRGRSNVTVAELVTWAEDHLFERRAVVEEFELLAAALARGRGEDVDLDALREALSRRDYARDAASTKLTSREVLRCELAIVFAARDGRGAHGALAPEFQPSAKLSAEQDTAVRQILGSRDFITLFRGGAGTGKSFALQEVHRGLAKAERPMVVVAPQRQQVTDLTRDGLPAQTLAQLLATKQLLRGAVVIVDEAGQVGGQQMRELITLTQQHGGRLILSGDTRQHGAVAASDALRAIEAYGGITTAEIATIRRQDPARGRSPAERSTIARYRAAVKAAAAGDLHASFAILDRLGCVRELPEPDRRAVLAAEYLTAARRKESALVVAQTWAEVRAINEAIRGQLLAAGALGRGSPVTAFQAIDATLAQRRDPGFYQAGQSAFFVRRYGRFAKGELYPICGANARGVVLLKNGRRSTLSFRYAERIIVATPTDMAVAAGDRLQLKFNGRSVEGWTLNNGELVTVRAVRRNGEIVVAADDGTRKTLASAQRLFNRGYAVTSYASQGKTVDTVLFADASNRAATNSQQWYVTISRGRKRVIVFTPDKEALRAAVQRAGDRELALELKQRPDNQPQVRRGSPAWVRRAKEVIATLQRIKFLRQRRTPAPGLRLDPQTVRTPARGLRHRL
jgi:conjugative relaxase-like TrwC/TraI family protein